MREPWGAVIALGILLLVFAVTAFAGAAFDGGLPQWAGWLLLLVLGAGALLVLLRADRESPR